MARYYGVPLRNGLPIGLGSAISLRKPGGAPAAVPDPYFEYTTLLLPGNGTNGAQNNTFLDSSTNNFTITRSGNTTQGTFSPFSQTGWGAYFNGGTSCLTFTKNASTSSVTLECWFYFTENASIRHILFGGDNSNSANNCQFAVENNGAIFVSINAGASLNVTTSSGVVPKSQWNHIAFVRNGSAWTFYVNGTSVGTGTSAAAINVDRIGDVGAAGATPVGYISNARIVDSAVYTSTFTPSITPLTAISNTYLLTLQSNRYVDNSGNARAITVSGTTISIQAFSPFNPTAAWSAATNGGSGYFDGSGDFFSTTTNIAAIGTGDFTLEVWCYPTASTSYRYFLAIGPDTNFATGLSTGGYAPYLYSSGFIITSSISTVPNAWNHVQYVRSSGTLTVYVNGVSGGSVTWTGSIAAGRGYIGANDSNLYYFVGYHSSLRFSNIARSATVPTAPYTSDANTQLLCNFTNAGIYDATSKNDLETVGNAQISTTQSKFGGSSMYFDGTGDWLAAPLTENLKFGTGDFTIEGWFYNSAAQQSASGIFSYLAGATYFVMHNNAGGYANKLSIWVDAYTGTPIIVGSTTLVQDTWYHFAISRASGVWRLFLNGVQEGSNYTNSGEPVPANAQLRIALGNNSGGFGGYTGYMDDFRITKGYARYTANFTPPTSAFPLL